MTKILDSFLETRTQSNFEEDNAYKLTRNLSFKPHGMFKRHIIVIPAKNTEETKTS